MDKKDRKLRKQKKEHNWILRDKNLEIFPLKTKMGGNQDAPLKEICH